MSKTSNYQLTFRNKTDRAWQLAIFIVLPGARLDSVCWKRLTAAGGGQSQPFNWSPQLFVAVGGFRRERGKLVYSTLHQERAEPGSRWKIVMRNGAAQLEADGRAQISDQIQVKNDSGGALSLGLGLESVGAIFKREVPSGLLESFDTSPTYFAQAFDSIAPGQLISDGQSLRTTGLTEPLPLDSGALEVSIEKSGDSIRLVSNNIQVNLT